MWLPTAGSLIVVVISCAIITPLLVDADILRFGGPDPNAIDYRAAIYRLPIPPNNYLVFLPYNVTNNATGGMLYAFQAYVVQKFQQFDFQIYRPKGSSFSKIFSLTVRTSTANQIEAFYLASYLGNQPCVYVQPGDRLALNFYNSMFPVFISWKPDDPQIRVAFITDFGLASIQFIQPFIFAASAYYDTNATPPPSADTVNVTCNTSIIIPSQFLPTTVPPTSTTPYVTIIGNTGATGLPGLTGATGNTGPAGAAGLWVGVKGAPGLSPSGPSGANGPNGENGMDSYFTGVQGYNGSIGPDGDRGQTGVQGQTGVDGPIGLMGNNETVVIKGPFADMAAPTWWLRPSAIQGCYIWLAIISFIFIVAVVIAMVTCCIQGEVDGVLNQ